MVILPKSNIESYVISKLRGESWNLEIAIFDFGGQYVFNIKRILLEKGVDVEIIPYNISQSKLHNCKGIIFSGGPYSVYDMHAPTPNPDILKLQIPILGLCYGHQLLAHLLGGEVRKGKIGEYGFSEIRVDTSNVLFRGLNKSEICWMSHGDVVSGTPSHSKVTASSRESKIAAFQVKDLFFGLQFHPEVSHTPNGHIILENFARLCDCSKRTWDVKDFIEANIHKIQKQVGDEHTIIAVSGGIDSSTAAILASKALKNNITSIHINHGLLRKNESQQVIELLKNIGLKIFLVNSEERFLNALKEINQSDEKRLLMGRLFIDEFEKVAAQIDATWLIQGTIAPDVIESTRGEAEKQSNEGHGGLIKIHHNVAGLPKGMKLKLLEPLSNLFKYQVRILARELGLPPELTERQPFPGPGLSCRISEEITSEKLTLLQEITTIVEKELSRYNPSQYFPILLTGKVISQSPKALEIASKYFQKEVNAYKLGDQAVGVKGDERVIGHPICISISESSFFLDTQPWITYLKMQSEVTGALPDICRVLIHLQGNITNSKGYGLVIRSIDTMDFMTAVPSKVKFTHISDLGKRIMEAFDQIKFVCYEITTKPASTIELF